MNLHEPTLKPVVAAFDFDDTLTVRDTLLPFLRYVRGVFPLAYYLLKLLPHLFRFFLGKCSRQQVKEQLLTYALKGISATKLRELGNSFAKESIDRLLRPEGQERLAWHQQQGHLCILISATLDFYLTPWATSQGFDHLICSQLEIDVNNRVTGRLLGLNCWGEEKVRRLQHLLGQRESYTLYAYGDSRGDRELLAYADYGYYRRFDESP